MNILGFSSFLDNSGAALVTDGELVAAVEEEKLVRRKYTGEFPIAAIKYCLEEGGIGIEDVDHVGFFFRPWIGFHKRLLHIAANLPDSLSFYGTRGNIWVSLLQAPRFTRRFLRKLGYRPRFKFHYVEHHRAHQASCFLVSPFEEAAIFTVDASGEIASATLGKGEGNRVRILSQINWPHSLGCLYAALTQYLGFRPSYDAGKVMGLTSYGDPARYRAEFEKLIWPKGDDSFEMDLSYFAFHRNGAIALEPHIPWVSDKFYSLFGPPRGKHDPLEQRHEDIAASLQEAVERVALHLVNHLYRLTRSKNLCIAGGVGLNSVMNGRLLRETPFEQVFVQPASGDGGTSLGAAFYVAHMILNQPRRFQMTHAYWGPEFSEHQMEVGLRDFKLEPARPPSIAKATARLLADGKIVGWFQGRLEFGPRALGNRSVLVDPRRGEMKDILNEKVKHRESFRPFAPSVLEEECGNYFDNDYPSPFMLLVYNTLPDKKDIIPAVTHVDGTARVQTVRRESNPLYYQLIEEFGKITSVPVILNTSFNDKGDPIVCSPHDAIHFFMKTKMDALAIGPFLIEKKS
jgi:carbamoyltransferase